MHINQVLNRDMLQARWKWFTLIIYYKRAFVPLKPVNGIQTCRIHPQLSASVFIPFTSSEVCALDLVTLAHINAHTSFYVYFEPEGI